MPPAPMRSSSAMQQRDARTAFRSLPLAMSPEGAPFWPRRHLPHPVRAAKPPVRAGAQRAPSRGANGRRAGATPTGTVLARSASASVPPPHTCTCSALQVRCRWVRGTAPLPPSRGTPLGLRLTQLLRARIESGEGDQGVIPPLPRQNLITQIMGAAAGGPSAPGCTRRARGGGCSRVHRVCRAMPWVCGTTANERRSHLTVAPSQCAGGELNPHALRHMALNHACLPVPAPAPASPGT